MLAPPWIPVPPPGYGGIEFVVALLCDALVEHGHELDLYCAPGSSSKATVHPVLDTPHPEHIERSLFEADHVARAFAAIDAEARAGRPFAIVHDHCGFTPLAMADRLDTPLVHTVHAPFDHDTTPYYAVHGRKGRPVCISRSQASAAPEQAQVASVIHNPIDVDSWPVGYYEQDYLLWVGRMVEEKGPHRAIAIAKEVGRPLILAGPVQPGHERFFSTQVEPHIDGELIRYVGEVGGARKQRLFADAFAFLMPIRWPEPFGMVMVEALAAGTPVLAFAHGAAPEIIVHAVNGFSSGMSTRWRPRSSRPPGSTPTSVAGPRRSASRPTESRPPTRRSTEKRLQARSEPLTRIGHACPTSDRASLTPRGMSVPGASAVANRSGSCVIGASAYSR
jgi:glycosyltransferase involved in cell wall biosynthesis